MHEILQFIVNLLGETCWIQDSASQTIFYGCCGIAV